MAGDSVLGARQLAQALESVPLPLEDSVALKVTHSFKWWICNLDPSLPSFKTWPSGLSVLKILAEFITRKNILIRIYKEWPNDRGGMLELSFEEWI